MCGIFAYYGKSSNYKFKYSRIKHRGPDNTIVKKVNNNLLYVFHRLAVNGLDHESDQPLFINNVWLICNGEIYNYQKLIDDNNFDYHTNSDCEVIIHMYLKYGMEYTLKSLDGVFAFVLYDQNLDRLYVARDPIGIRSLFYVISEEDICICSEAKGLTNFDTIQQFPPGSWYDYSSKKFYQYYSYDYKIIENRTEDIICTKLRRLLTDAVDKRLMADRKVCTLLSGGLDSTLVTALVKKHYPDYSLDTYAIGLKDSVDLHFARKAAKYLKTRHHEVIVTEEEFLDAIEKTIYQIESFCVTSVRASVGNYLVSLYIKSQGGHNEDPDYKFDKNANTVVFCGDLSDEIFASYRGFQNADTPENFFKENIKMVKDVHYYDVLRSDKSISGAGLEARVPFADKALVNYVMSISPELKMFNDERMEKYLLRKAFSSYSNHENQIISDELLWRRKEAFSDGVSGHQRSWFEIIKEFVDKKIPDDEFEQRCNKFIYLKPYDKESLYYREIFEKYYPGQAKMIPYYWRHPFSQQKDPSARLLDFYKVTK